MEMPIGKYGKSFNELLARPEWEPVMKLLHDLSDVNGGPLTVDNVFQVSRLCG